MKSTAAFLICLLISSASHADIILTIGTDTFAQNSGVQSLNVFARTDNSNTLLGLTADFVLEAGDFQTPPGTFGVTGMIGAGNLNIVGSSFTRSSATSALLSLDFNAPQLFPSANEVVATLNFDVNGLAPGTYQVRLAAGFADGDEIPTQNRFDGSFTIGTGAAVPEPGHAIVLLVAGLGLTGGRRILRRRKSAERLAAD